MDAIKERITEWASHVAGFDAIGAIANVIENGIEKHHAKGLECEAAWRAIEEAVVAEIAKELHRMRVVLNGGDRGSRDYVFARVAELRGNCRRCGYGRRKHQAPDGGGCAGDFAEQPKPQQPEVQPVSRNQMLLDFAQDWTLDGDLLRCRECKSACIASREDEEFVHRSDCKKRRAGAMPWKALVAILMQQPKSAGGA